MSQSLPSFFTVNRSRGRIGSHLVGLCLLGLGTASVALGAEPGRAVQATHLELSATGLDVDTDDSTSSGTLGFSALFTVPVGQYLGATVGGGYSETAVRTRRAIEDVGSKIVGVRPSCDFDTTDLNAGLFARWPQWGRIGASYGVGKLSADCGQGAFMQSGSDSLDTSRYRIEAEAYLGDFTLTLAHTATDLDGPELESDAVTASWYAFDNFKVSLGGTDLGGDNVYELMLEAQPEFMGDALSVRLGYSRSDNDPTVSTVTIGFSWFVGRRIPLKLRDRTYR